MVAVLVHGAHKKGARGLLPLSPDCSEPDLVIRIEIEIFSGSGSGAGAGLAADLAADLVVACGPVVTLGFSLGGIRTRRAPTMRPRKSAWVGKTAMIFPVQPSVSSPYAPRMVLLLVRLSANPFLLLVNHTTSFCD